MDSLRRATLVLVLLVLAALAPARAGIAEAPGADLDVSLVTYGPGDIYWERFGHDAIEVRDRVSGESINFNYGVFDFEEKNFILNFARGRMHYMMDAEASAPEEAWYAQVGRSVTRQRLALDASQAANLRDDLLWNLRPQNAGYNYDYYVDNCATRVRDALDGAVGGAMKSQLQAHAGEFTYRQQTVRLMSAQPWLMLILDLGLGPYADQPLNAWQESFLPAVLQAQLRQVRIAGPDGGSRPLVRDERVQSPNRLVPPPASPPDLRLPLGVTGLLLAGLLLVTRLGWPLGHALLGTLFLLLAGFVGVVLLGLWTLTSHHSAWANANLLLFNPLAWLLLPTLCRARRGFAASRFIDGLIVLQLLALLTALALHLLPGTVQQNQPWLLFALPCWLALAWSLRRNR
ncbi:lipoprotein N-acyltransferase Lnb domain-containing protein [Rhodanobacter lindaniclasticus]